MIYVDVVQPTVVVNNDTFSALLGWQNMPLACY